MNGVASGREGLYDDYKTKKNLQESGAGRLLEVEFPARAVIHPRVDAFVVIIVEAYHQIYKIQKRRTGLVSSDVR